MRVASRKSAGPVLRRDQMLNERARAAALRQVFPDIGQLRVELVFNDVSAHTPSPQAHTLYPSAPAFFRFACPCTDCDGDFDLTEAVRSLLARSTVRRRAPISISGQLSCLGVRLRDRASSRPCTMQLDYQLVSSSTTT